VNSVDHLTGDPDQNAGSVAPPESAAHLNSTKVPSPLAGDILHGADAIAEFLYGDRKSRRKVYHLVESANLPVFRLGINICARKSVLLDWIEKQEARQSIARSGSEEQA
jgi:hypothetical protein